MKARTVGRSVAAVTLVVVAAGGCTTPNPPVTPSPTPIQTPAETGQQRQQREAYEAAEKAYRTFRAEYGRVRKAGGAKEATAVMKQTAGGPYLATFVEQIQAAKGLGDHYKGTERILYVRPAGFATDSVLLNVCEDSREVRTLDKNNQEVGRGEIRTAQIEVRSFEQSWKLWSGRGKKVSSCE